MKRFRKIRPNKYKWIIPYSLMWLGLCCICLIGGMGWKIPLITKWGITIASVGALSTIAIALVTKKDRKISSLVDNFIKSNSLFQHHIDENGNLVMDYYPCVDYKVVESDLLLRFRLDGSKIGQKLRGLEQALADCFATLCIDVLEERGYITYVLELVKPEQEIIHSLNELPSLEYGKIQIGNITIPWQKYPHILLTGVTRAGKSVTAKVIMYLLKQQGVQVYYLDPKNDYEFKNFCKTFDIKYFSEAEDIRNTLFEINREIKLRQDNLDSMGLNSAPFNPIYVFFDELIAYSANVGSKRYNEVLGEITSIIMQGGGKNVFFGAIMQRCDTRYIDGVLRDSLHIRIAMGNMNKTSYEMMFPDTPDVKNYRIEKGSGLIYRLGIDKRPKELLVPYIVNE